MLVKFVHLAAEDVFVLPPGYSLILNVDEYIVTLVGSGCICAQCRVSRSAFRLLFLLLRSPDGVEYATLLAGLRCSEAVFRRLLLASSYAQIVEILTPQIERWNKHLERSARQGQAILEKDLKMVRRAVKERRGVNTILKKNGFALAVRAMYRKGYLLTRSPAVRLEEVAYQRKP